MNRVTMATTNSLEPYYVPDVTDQNLELIENQYI